MCGNILVKKIGTPPHFPTFCFQWETTSVLSSLLPRVTIPFQKGSSPGLPRLEKNDWKMKFFPGQREVREFCGWLGKFRKDFESQGKVREFENR